MQKLRHAKETTIHLQSRVFDRFKPGGKISQTVLLEDQGNKIPGGQKHKQEDYIKQKSRREGEEQTKEQQLTDSHINTKTTEKKDSDELIKDFFKLKGLDSEIITALIKGELPNDFE